MLVTNIFVMGRWERTHEALRKAALDLFTEYGYEATGTAQVAEHVGVSEMTLFRHFPTKESLIVADSFDPFMAEAVRVRPVGEPPMQALTEGLRAAWVELPEEAVAFLRRRLKIIAQTPALTGAIERSNGKTVMELANALVDRGVDDVWARIASSAVIAGLSTALLIWANTERCTLSEALESACDLLGGN